MRPPSIASPAPMSCPRQEPLRWTLASTTGWSTMEHTKNAGADQVMVGFNVGAFDVNRLPLISEAGTGASTGTTDDEKPRRPERQPAVDTYRRTRGQRG